MSTPDWYRWDGEDLVINLKLQPKASTDAFAEVQHERMRVRITAPPVDGKANAHLATWLARQFDVPKSAVSIETGQASRSKRVRIRSPGRLPDMVEPPRRS